MTRKKPGSMFPLLALTLVTGCSAGPYGYARHYVPLDSENRYHESSREYTWGAVTARPQDFVGQRIAWFGIVERVEADDDGRSLVKMQFHKHRRRHLCEGETESTCRVTVSHKPTGGFSAAVRLHPEDTVPGLDKVQPGTLMRVFGQVRCATDADGNPRCDLDSQGDLILYCDHYRQWPARHYRTTRSADKMVR